MRIPVPIRSIFPPIHHSITPPPRYRQPLLSAGGPKSARRTGEAEKCSRHGTDYNASEKRDACLKKNKTLPIPAPELSCCGFPCRKPLNVPAGLHILYRNETPWQAYPLIPGQRRRLTSRSHGPTFRTYGDTWQARSIHERKGSRDAVYQDIRNSGQGICSGCMSTYRAQTRLPRLFCLSVLQ